MSEKVDEYIKARNLQECIIYNDKEFKYEVMFNNEVYAWVSSDLPDDAIIKWFKRYY